MRRMVVFAFATMFLLFLGSSSLFAQSHYGSVRGTVKDPQGAAVPDAKVTLTNVATNVKQDATTNGDGIFVFPYVAPADYELSILKEGFRTSTARVTVEVAQQVNLNLSLELGKVTETVTVIESAISINTTNGEVAHEITGRQLHELPLLNQNTYGLMLLTPGASDTGSVTGDTRGGSVMAGGGGVAVGGARTSSINFMLDGTENNDTFIAGAAQDIPLDSVQEFKMQTNGASAEYGRNPVVANVVTKGGTNRLHGDAYEVYRGAGLATNAFDDKASGTPKSNFVRNQFGGSVGGPIIKDKLFFFGSLEGIRVRSAGSDRFFVPTPAFIANAAAPVVTYLNANPLAQQGNCSDSALSASSIWNDTEGNRNANGTSSYGTPDASGNIQGLYVNGAASNATGTGLIPGTTNLFCRVTLTAPIDAGGGTPQNTWLTNNRVDYQFSSKTSAYFRFAYTKTDQPVGAGSVSPFVGFSTPATARSQNTVAALTHAFSASVFGELRASYNRVNPNLPLGKAPGTAPCWQYNRFNHGITPTGDTIVMPGYLPTACLASGLDVGGPQNVYTEAGSLTWLKGKNTFKFGGSYFHMRHNHTFGAYENGYYESADMNSLLGGQINFFAQALNPQGHVPGDPYCAGPTRCTTLNGNPVTPSLPVDGPFQPPSFTRHYHYNELAGFAQDTLKWSPKLSITFGTRWEYFGVQHSPENEHLLDANLYLNAVGGVDPTIFQQVRDARFRRTNQFYKPDYNDFGPRAGIAYDVFGNGRTVFRAGYGFYYDRNFGNATFNAIQNPPNYAVFTGNSTDFFPTTFTINPNEYTIIANAAAGGAFTVSSSARMLNNDFVTATSQQWNATVEHNVLNKGIIASVSYLGSRGDHLYSLNNLNQRGSCLLLLSVGSGPCSGGGPGLGSYRINRSGLTGMNRRGNEGLSRYHALAFDVRSQEIGKTGLLVFGTYTWAHAIDNSSSFFGDSSFEGNFGFGFRDPYNPSQDRASSSNDIRHRGTFSFIWDVPVMKGQKSLAGQAFGGWSLTGIFQAQTGGTFSVYDGSSGFAADPLGRSSQCNDSGTNFCFPVFTGGAVPSKTATPTGNANTVTLYNLANAPFVNQDTYCTTHTLTTPATPAGSHFGGGASVGNALGYNAFDDNYACTAAIANLYSNLVSARNLFRTPGLWNMDVAISKTFRMPREGYGLKLRADFINMFNHANLYADPVTNIFSPGGAVLAHRGVPNCFPGSCGKERRNIQVTAMFTF